MVVLFSMTTKTFAQGFPPEDFFPQANQVEEWTVSALNELQFDGGQPATSPAIIATTFGGLVANDYTNLKLTFDAFISSSGQNTQVVLSSNAVWGGKGIIIEINKFQLQVVKNFSYPGTALIDDFSAYQTTLVKPDAYNSFIIDVNATGEITVTMNGFVCPISYTDGLSVLTSPTPVPRYAYFTTGFTGFKLRNLKVDKSGTIKEYFTTALPINLLSFNAFKKAEGNILNWETASEINNSHFLVLRSSDNLNYKEIAKVTGNNQASKYQHLDKQPLNGSNYYKLVQVDFNGNTDDLGVKVLDFDLKLNNAMVIYPNPAVDKVNININRKFDSATTVKILDLSGKVLQKATIQSQNQPFNYVLNFNNSIKSGIYILNVSSGDYKQSEKLIVK